MSHNLSFSPGQHIQLKGGGGGIVQRAVGGGDYLVKMDNGGEIVGVRSENIITKDAAVAAKAGAGKGVASVTHKGPMAVTAKRLSFAKKPAKPAVAPTKLTTRKP